MFIIISILQRFDFLEFEACFVNKTANAKLNLGFRYTIFVSSCNSQILKHAHEFR